MSLIPLLKRCSISFLIALTLLSQAQARETLHVAHDQWIGYSAFFIANNKGFFEEVGLDIRTTQFSGPGDTMPPLLAGHIDIGLTTLYNLALVAGKGDSSLTSIYLLDTSNGADAIVAEKSIGSPAELKGKRIAVTVGEVNHLLLMAALQGAGLKESDVTLVNMNADDAGAALLSGRVDAAVTWEPWVTRATALGNKAIFTSADTPDLILDSIVVTNATLANRKDALVLFIKAINKGVQYLREHPQESHAIIANVLDVSPTDVADMLAGDKIYDIADNKSLLAPNGKGYDSLNAVVEFLTGQGLLSKPIDGRALLTGSLLP